MDIGIVFNFLTFSLNCGHWDSVSSAWFQGNGGSIQVGGYGIGFDWNYCIHEKVVGVFSFLLQQSCV